MVKIYAKLILKGLKTIDEVPSALRNEVAEILGYTGDDVK